VLCLLEFLQLLFETVGVALGRDVDDCSQSGEDDENAVGTVGADTDASGDKDVKKVKLC
jgi:hypothetical protein